LSANWDTVPELVPWPFSSLEGWMPPPGKPPTDRARERLAAKIRLLAEWNNQSQGKMGRVEKQPPSEDGISVCLERDKRTAPCRRSQFF
jgi:hypothetical protein